MAADGKLTVEQLAHASGMTVRNIRNHQSRGLLAPPTVVARIGYYGAEHLDRLRLIQEMQADGFNLEAIRRLLEDSPGRADALAGFRRVIAAPFSSETPEIVTGAELAERFGRLDGRVLARTQALGLLVPVGEGHYEAPSPALLRAAEDVVARGVSLRAALDAIERVQSSADAIARTLVRLFLDELWKPVRDGDERDARWPEVVDAIEQLRPVASEVVLALFAQALGAEVQRAFARELERSSRRRR